MNNGSKSTIDRYAKILTTVYILYKTIHCKKKKYAKCFQSQSPGFQSLTRASPTHRVKTFLLPWHDVHSTAAPRAKSHWWKCFSHILSCECVEKNVLRARFCPHACHRENPVARRIFQQHTVVFKRRQTLHFFPLFFIIYLTCPCFCLCVFSCRCWLSSLNEALYSSSGSKL